MIGLRDLFLGMALVEHGRSMPDLREGR